MTIKEKINGRTCAVLLSGASLELLRRFIGHFTQIDLCWCGINTFHLPETNILSCIQKKFDVVLDISEVAEPDVYDLKCRFPRVNKYLSETEGLYVTTPKLLKNMKKNDKKGKFELNKDKISYIEEYVDVNTIHNSLGAYLHMLTKCGAKKIYLFGCDGYAGQYIEYNAMLSYFCPKEIIEDYQIGFAGAIHCALGSDTEAFNGSFEVSYLGYCIKHRLVPAEIYNVSTNSFINIFPRITLSEAQHTLMEEQDAINRKIK